MPTSPQHPSFSPPPHTPSSTTYLGDKEHDSDIIDRLRDLEPTERIDFFKTAPLHHYAPVFCLLNIEEQLTILTALPLERASVLIVYMKPDMAATLVEELNESNQHLSERLLAALPHKTQHHISTLLSYQDGCIGAIMNPDPFYILDTISIGIASSLLQKKALPESESTYYIHVVNTNHVLLGYITLHDLLTQHAQTNVATLIKPYPLLIHPHHDQEYVARVFQHQGISMLPITSKESLLVGSITVADMVDVVVEEASEDIYKLTGTTTDKQKYLLSKQLIYPILSRLPWLSITLLGGLCASFIIHFYSQLLSSSAIPLALSLSFIPMLMGLGGNVGNQSSAIIVRGLALHTISIKRTGTVIIHELFVGLAIGAIVSIILFLTTFFLLNYTILFCSIVSMSIFINTGIAATIGSLLPLLLAKLKLDPAVASAPVISSTLDVIGQLVYFTITLILLGYVT